MHDNGSTICEKSASSLRLHPVKRQLQPDDEGHEADDFECGSHLQPLRRTLKRPASDYCLRAESKAGSEELRKRRKCSRMRMPANGSYGRTAGSNGVPD